MPALDEVLKLVRKEGKPWTVLDDPDGRASAIDLFTAALQKQHVSPRARSELLQIIDEMKGDIVEAWER